MALSSTSRLAQEVSKLDWTKFRPAAAAQCLPAMGIALGLGLLYPLPAAGIVAATGALTVGFASFRRLQGSQLLPMLLTIAGMFAAAWLGTLAGRSPFLAISLAGFFGIIYGLILLFSEDASWVGLQCVIAFLVASAFPAHGWHALIRGALVALGGALQAGLLLAFWNSERLRSLKSDFYGCRPAGVMETIRGHIVPAILKQVDHRLPAMRYAARLGITLMLAVGLSHLLHQVNFYWLPMTTLIVMKPDFYRTYTGAVGRVLGTFLGVALASLLTFGLHPNAFLLWLLVLIFAWASFAWQKVNYAIFSCVLTAFIVFMIATAGLPEPIVTANRLLDTALGALMALGSRAVGFRWDSLPTIAASQPTVA